MTNASAETLRAFLAVEPSEEARREAMGVTQALREAPDGDGVRWARPESLHVTLHFLGDIERGEVAPVASHVAAEVRDVGLFDASLGALSAFPSPRRARVVVLGIEPEQPLTELADAVGRGVQAAGLPAIERAFRPHLTLGRVRRGRRAPRLEAVPALSAARFCVHEVVLFRSRLGQGGATYHALERLPLGMSPDAGDHPTNPN
jgi:2'-5' RNA ligase